MNAIYQKYEICGPWRGMLLLHITDPDGSRGYLDPTEHIERVQQFPVKMQINMIKKFYHPSR